MVTVSNFGTWILEKNNYGIGDCPLARVEDLIDDAIDHINLVAGTSIADLSGASESKSVTASENELTCIKKLSALLVRAYVDKGSQVAVGGVGVTEVASDPHYKIHMKLFNQSLQYLRGRSFLVT